MLRSVVFVALAASAMATSASLGCQTITITPASGSICKSASGSICTTPAGATALQTTLTAAWSAMTSAVVQASGTAACTAIGGTMVSSFWTNPSTWGCDGKNPDPCNAATCGSTATAAPAPPATVLPYCCASIRSCISTACSGIPNLATVITPAGPGNGTAAILSALGMPGACVDTSCQNYPCGAASGVTYSVLAVLLAALLALFQF